jgi:phosphomannomutase
MDIGWLEELARAFAADDPDPGTRAEVDELLARGDWAELEERFGSQIEFGTAGLRGLIGAGTSRMNRRVVARTTAGLCAYLARVLPRAAERGLCLGFDGRHQSRAFAEEVRAVACGAGFVVHLFSDVVPTPLLAFSVLDREAAGGVVITASHNPAEYNGYKVYLADGAQLASPHDAAISDAIAALPPVLALPRLSRDQAHALGRLCDMDGVEDRYVESVTRSLGTAAPGPLQLRVAYTALHGVGARLASRVLLAAGVRALHGVAEQAEPDPDFPTVAFPNPEEPHAMDRVLALAEHVRADLVIANDPDADRLALAAPDGAQQLRPLTGNEIGMLLCDHLLARAPRDGRNLIVTTIVSTPLVERIAAQHGARCVRTLTGFKWIVARAGELEREAGYRFVLGFEEALGYCIGGLVRDKDGIAAAAHAAQLAEEQRRQGLTLHDALDALYARHGLCVSEQVSFTLKGTEGLAQIQRCMARLRAAPPTELAGLRVCSLLDLVRGALIRDGRESTAELPQSDVIALELEGGHRVTVRPSGTEPKLKVYLDVFLPFEPPRRHELQREQARPLVQRLVHALIHEAGGLPLTSVTRY